MSARNVAARPTATGASHSARISVIAARLARWWVRGEVSTRQLSAPGTRVSAASARVLPCWSIRARWIWPTGASAIVTTPRAASSCGRFRSKSAGRAERMTVALPILRQGKRWARRQKAAPRRSTRRESGGVCSGLTTGTPSSAAVARKSPASDTSAGSCDRSLSPPRPSACRDSARTMSSGPTTPSRNRRTASASGGGAGRGGATSRSTVPSTCASGGRGSGCTRNTRRVVVCRAMCQTCGGAG